MRKAMLIFYGKVPRGQLNTGWYDSTPVSEQHWVWLDGQQPGSFRRRCWGLVCDAEVGDIWQFEYGEWAGAQAHGAGWTPVKKDGCDDD